MHYRKIKEGICVVKFQNKLCHMTLGLSLISKEVKFFKKSNTLDFSTYFSTKIEQSSIKCLKMAIFGSILHILSTSLGNSVTNSNLYCQDLKDFRTVLLFMWNSLSPRFTEDPLSRQMAPVRYFCGRFATYHFGLDGHPRPI